MQRHHLGEAAVLEADGTETNTDIFSDATGSFKESLLFRELLWLLSSGWPSSAFAQEGINEILGDYY